MKVTKKKTLFAPIEVRGKDYVVSFGYKEIDETQATWEEVKFCHKPSVGEIREYINAFYNEVANKAILYGMHYGGGMVWLSNENQHNYLSQFNLAMAAMLSSDEDDVFTFDYTIKLSRNDGSTFYHRFETAESYMCFYRQVSAYINRQVTLAREYKDSIDYSLYE